MSNLFGVSLEPLHKDVVRGFLLNEMVGDFQRFELKVQYRKLSGLENSQTFDVYASENQDGPEVRIKKRPL